MITARINPTMMVLRRLLRIAAITEPFPFQAPTRGYRAFPGA